MVDYGFRVVDIGTAVHGPERNLRHAHAKEPRAEGGVKGGGWEEASALEEARCKSCTGWDVESSAGKFQAQGTMTGGPP